ncbi:MAG: hypothetical protein A3J46_05175 [Candidatus Yanofskybacteria bacterium RIFCSPHIGHO2_02_FULL_41_11]|uniref:Polymerase beta nucleotidyltransferase domain-containing protein n=1 Tax=Candidatus Yanofskybacteria bacterium RIFCSPHIGHO2_02_FULL_41_11 TaxID=1802675 RepID=A0A1F8FA31_9BACT|nr:MAG: hypothetical protein A3J46_05175 [Candidatus Yanofskybacteria bacterium RIFCSPHIGHO2_02_FULL_41_11]
MVEQDIQKITDTIIEKFKPERIMLFGSRAWGSPNKDSDIDLFIVKDDRKKNTREMAIDLERILSDRDIPLDILVYKPEQITKRLAVNDQFIAKIWRDGKILYERQ